jgi:antitoxin MazE
LAEDFCGDSRGWPDLSLADEYFRCDVPNLTSPASRNYNVIMKSSLVQIGNSRGVRIPKAFLDQAGLRDDVEIEVRGSEIVVRTLRRTREGWREAFRKMAANGDDALLDADASGLSSWDEREWEW